MENLDSIEIVECREQIKHSDTIPGILQHHPLYTVQWLYINAMRDQQVLQCDVCLNRGCHWMATQEPATNHPHLRITNKTHDSIDNNNT